MKCIETLRTKLESIGATLDVDDFTIHCDAPSGYVWKASGCRSIPIQYANTGGQQWAVKAIREEEKDRLAMGLEKVTDPAQLAMHRHDEGDDDWGADESALSLIPFPH